MTAELAALFASAFLSATILPGSSEAVLVAVLASGATSPTEAIAVATVGNTLGSVVNWLIGRFLASYRDHPRFPISRTRYERTVAMYRRWGVWSLLLSWAPVIGDALTLVAGVMRTPLTVVLVLVTLAKLGRYLLVAGMLSVVAAHL